MKHKTMLSLATVHQHCISLDKSTEYTLQLMQDATGQSLDTCVKYLNYEPYHHRQLIEEVNLVLSITDRLNIANIAIEMVVFEILTKTSDVIYVRSNLDIYKLIEVLLDTQGVEVKSYTLADEDEFLSDDELDYIIVY